MLLLVERYDLAVLKNIITIIIIIIIRKPRGRSQTAAAKAFTRWLHHRYGTSLGRATRFPVCVLS